MSPQDAVLARPGVAEEEQVRGKKGQEQKGGNHQS